MPPCRCVFLLLLVLVVACARHPAAAVAAAAEVAAAAKPSKAAAATAALQAPLRRRLSGDEDGGVQAAIVGGVAARKGRYPYMVSLRRNARGEPLFCGGTLIAPRIVLTAAHCFFNTRTGRRLDASYTRPKVRIGGIELKGGRYEARAAVALLLPSAYRPASKNVDVALLLLNAPSAQPYVRLAPGKKKGDRFPAGTPLSAVGWGKLSWGGQLPQRLQEVVLDYIPLRQCEESAPDLDWASNSMICAGSPRRRKNSCSGDSGGPLLRKGRRSAADVQVGIVSWGWECGRGKPGVYSDVAALRGFIDRGVRQLLAAAAGKPARKQGVKAA